MGGAMGIGRHMALRFASLGALVLVWDVNAAAGQQVVQEITDQAAGSGSGDEAHFYEVDVADRGRVEAVGWQIVEQFEGVDILVNNGGIYHSQSFLDAPARLLERTMQVNTLAHFWTIRAFLPAMLKRGSGHIVCVSSAAGYLGFPSMVDCGASKFATVGLMSSLRQELRLLDPSRSIRLTLACPSFTSTGMFEGVTLPVLTTWLSPEYAADAIVAAVRRDQWRVLLPSIMPSSCSAPRCCPSGSTTWCCAPRARSTPCRASARPACTPVCRRVSRSLTSRLSLPRLERCRQQFEHWHDKVGLLLPKG